MKNKFKNNTISSRQFGSSNGFSIAFYRQKKWFEDILEFDSETQKQFIDASIISIADIKHVHSKCAT